jgi:hypothetical protein
MTSSKYTIILSLLGISVIASSFIFCKRQGIEGQVLLVSGNQMPSPDIKPSPGKGIKTTLYIYQLTNLSQVNRVGQSAFYAMVNSKLVKKIVTKDNGYFKVKLSPGQYSVFLMKDTLFYANRFDGRNNIAPVEVTPKKMTKIEVKMDYSAVY